MGRRCRATLGDGKNCRFSREFECVRQNTVCRLLKTFCAGGIYWMRPRSCVVCLVRLSRWLYGSLMLSLNGVEMDPVINGKVIELGMNKSRLIRFMLIKLSIQYVGRLEITYREFIGGMRNICVQKIFYISRGVNSQHCSLRACRVRCISA